MLSWPNNGDGERISFQGLSNLWRASRFGYPKKPWKYMELDIGGGADTGKLKAEDPRTK
jgi:hypothetical protein